MKNKFCGEGRGKAFPLSSPHPSQPPVRDWGWGLGGEGKGGRP